MDYVILVVPDGAAMPGGAVGNKRRGGKQQGEEPTSLPPGGPGCSRGLRPLACGVHYICSRRLDPQHVQALLEHARGQVAQDQAAGALLGLRTLSTGQFS